MSVGTTTPKRIPTAGNLVPLVALVVLTGLVALFLPGRAGAATTVRGVAGAATPRTVPHLKLPQASEGRTLYVTNLHSDNIAGFTVGKDGSPVPNGSPTLTEDQGGAGFIVLSPDGRIAYVVDRFSENVLSYRVAPDGSLTPLGTPVSIGGTAPIGMALAPDGRRLYISSLSSATISVFAIGDDGTPAPMGDPVPTGAADPRGLAITPDGRFLYVGHGNPDAESTDILQRFTIGGDGTLGALVTVATTGGAGSGLGVTPDGRFLYLTALNNDQVDGYRIGPDGDLTAAPGSPYTTANRPEGLAVSPDGRYVFATSSGKAASDGIHAISAFTVGEEGALTLVQGSPFDGGNSPIGVSTTPDGRYLFVSNNTQVLSFAIQSGGVLKETADSPVSSGGETPAFMSLAVVPDQGPVAALSATAAVAGAATRLDASGSADTDGKIARYDWDFGDGTVLHDGGPAPEHVYHSPGTFTVHVTVTDNEGCSAQRVYTGQLALCNGSAAASATRTLTMR